ncbi:hypothetical protein GF340_04695 [Candidatus Peregrinibacteria bacterium]|nr:hypothetical protein [Candidatus Peregrinibacteria bacterium]
MSYLKLATEKILVGDNSPQSVFSVLRNNYSVLLESSKDGRYSYVVYDPFLVVWRKKHVTQSQVLKEFFDIKKKGDGGIVEDGESWFVEEVLKKFEQKMDGPVPFCGGAVGYLSYDYGVELTGVDQQVFDDVQIPDYSFGFYDKVIAFDHETGVMHMLALAESDLKAERKIEEIKNEMTGEGGLIRKGEIGDIESNLSKESYLEKIEKVKEYLKDGETYQVNFSQRFKAKSTLDGFKVYKKMTRDNPTPYACYFKYPDFEIVSCSPELLIKKEGASLESWPIKGTVERKKNKNADDYQARKLLNDKKIDAELSMIVDLVRNDLGIISEIGSVEVKEHKALQYLSHVIHTFSKIGSQVRKGVSVFEILKAMFPGGSITGCPKKRTVEIIDKLEDFKRGVYTGSAGFIGFNGEMEFNILIRTLLLKDNYAFFGAGGGIVVDSDGQSEYEETINKVKVIFESLK